MTESTDSIKNNEVTDNEIKNLRQFPDAAKTEVLNAIGSESEQGKLPVEKVTNQYGIGSLISSKPSDQTDGKHPNISRSDTKPQEAATTLAINSGGALSDSKTVTEEMARNIDRAEAVTGSEVDLVPESMYSVLQQRAQNVLKMISEKKYPEALPQPIVRDDVIRQTLTGSNHNQNSEKQSTDSVSKDSCNSSKDSSEAKSKDSSEVNSKDSNDIKSKDSNDAKSKDSIVIISKDSIDVKSKDSIDVKSKDSTDIKSKDSIDIKSKDSIDIKSKDSIDIKSKDSIDIKSKDSIDIKSKDSSNVKLKNVIESARSSITEQSSQKLVKLDVPQVIVSKMSSDHLQRENAGDKELEKPVHSSLSPKSSRSTEQCTTDYLPKNTGIDCLIVQDVKKITSKQGEQRSSSDNLQQQGLAKLSEDAVKAAANDQMMVSRNNNEVANKLSNIIDSIETPAHLSKKAELIFKLFKQKLSVKLDPTGNVDESSLEETNKTALKFALWMEDILKEIDSRAKSSKEKQEDSRVKDEERQQDASRESITKTKEAGENDNEKEEEVIKMQELSDSELLHRYGSYLLRESYDLFEFVGPDNCPVEVRHITAVVSKKVMIVKKKISETHWSNWVIEVGPEVSLDSVSECVQSGERQNTHTMAESEGERNLSKSDWDNWRPNIFKEKVAYIRMPLLKQQCMITEADFEIEYPSYPMMYQTTTGVVNIFEDNMTVGQPRDCRTGGTDELL